MASNGPDQGEVGKEDGSIKEVVHSLINAKGTSSSQLQLAINSSLIPSCMSTFCVFLPLLETTVETTKTQYPKRIDLQKLFFKT